MWLHILIGWVLLFILPKLAVIPVYRWLWAAMKASDALDARDAAWLRSQEEGDGRWPPPWRPVDPPLVPRSGPERRRPGGTGRRRRTRVG